VWKQLLVAVTAMPCNLVRAPWNTVSLSPCSRCSGRYELNLSAEFARRALPTGNGKQPALSDIKSWIPHPTRRGEVKRGRVSPTSLLRLLFAERTTDPRILQTYLRRRDPKPTAHTTRVAGRRFGGHWPIGSGRSSGMVKKGEPTCPRAGADQMSRKPANVRIAVQSFAERHFSRIARHPLTDWIN